TQRGWLDRLAVAAQRELGSDRCYKPRTLTLVRPFRRKMAELIRCVGDIGAIEIVGATNLANSSIGGTEHFFCTGAAGEMQICRHRYPVPDDARVPVRSNFLKHAQ